MSKTKREQRVAREPDIKDSAGGASESERLLHLVTNRSPVSIAYCGADRTYKFANKLYAERFGLRPQDIIGMTICEVFGKESYAGIEPFVEDVLSGRRVEFEWEESYQGNGPRYVWVNYEPEFDDTGRVT